MDIQLIEIPTVKSENGGSLFFIEALKDVSFEFKRVYYITNENHGAHRGFHAHKKLRQVLFCPFGKIEIILDNGIKKEIIILDSPQKGLVIETLVWREMIWKEKNSVLCVLASEHYDENDYIRNYQDFLSYLEE